jgi:gliding motility-associated-like protein
LLEEWGIDATTTLTPNINFNNLADLAIYMNSVEPAGAWFVDGLNVKAGNPDVRYRAGAGLQFFSEDPEAATYTVRYNDKTTYTGSLLTLEKGCHEVVLVDTLTGCRDTAQICVLGCFAVDTIRDTNVVTTTTTVCLPVESGAVAGATSIVNCGHANNTGNVYTVASNGCITIVRSTTVGYSLDTLCIVVRDTVTGLFDTTVAIFSNLPKIDTIRDTNRTETTTTVCIPVEPGMSNTVTTIVNCGHTINSGNTYTVDSNGCITIVRSTTVGFNLDTICIIVTDTITGISDTTVGIFSNTPSCPDLIRDTTIACTSVQGAGLCVPLTLQEIRKYNIYIDGTKSAQQFSSRTGCGQTLVDAGFNFSVIDYVDNVPHLLEGLDLDGTSPLEPMINFNNLTELATYLNSVDAAGAWFVDGLNIKTANPNTRYRNGDGIAFFSEDPEAATYTVRYNDKTTYTSSLIAVPNGCHQVVLVDTTTGCVDSATICVVGNCGPKDTIRIPVPVDSTVTHCYLTPADSNVVVTTCAGDTIGETGLGHWTIDSAGCLHYTAGSVIGIDTLCIVKCNTLVNKCDTIVTIITIIPTVDIIRDTNLVNTTTTVCMPLEDGFTPTSVSIINCGYNNNSGNVYTPSGTQCITIVRSNTVGYNLDTLCVVVCNAAGVCDTTKVIVSNTPKSDTVEVEDSIEVCVKTLPRDSNVVVKTCDGGTSTVTVLGTFTIDPITQCIKYVAGSVIGNDTLCIVKCDTVTGKCDTVRPVIVIIPRIDTLRDTNIIGTTTTVCMPLENGFGTPVSTQIINCGHANNSGNAYQVSTTGSGCIDIARSNTVGFDLDTICVVVCNASGLCDTTKVIVSNLPRIDTIIDTIRTTVPENDTVKVCSFITGDTTGVTITNCDGSVMGTTIYNGTWSIDSNKCLVYTAGSVKLNDTLCILVCRGDTCKQVTVIVTVTGLPPVAVNDTVETDINTPITIPVLNNDIKTDEDPLTLCDDRPIVTNPVHGTVIVNQNGTITYTPFDNYVGIDSFQYQICDPEGRDTAWVFITIKGTCDLPTVITPNGDGFNENFVIPCPSTTAIVFCVYNRWGIEVYRSEDYRNDFDGRYRGAPLPDGTYYYVVKYTNDEGTLINRASYLTIRR